MARMRNLIVAVAIGALTSGCSTRPRNFSANLSAPVADRTTFQQDYRTCQFLVASGRKEGFKSAAAQGLAAGAGTIGGTALVTGLGAGVNIGTGAASASLAAVPVIGILAGFGVSRMIRSGRERKFKRTMSACLTEYGYTVEGWSKLRKKQDPALIAAGRAQVADRERAPGTPAEPPSGLASSTQPVAKVLVTEPADAIERVSLAVP